MSKARRYSTIGLVISILGCGANTNPPKEVAQPRATPSSAVATAVATSSPSAAPPAILEPPCPPRKMIGGVSVSPDRKFMLTLGKVSPAPEPVFFPKANVNVWNLSTGERVADLETWGPADAAGLLATWTRDDSVLVFAINTFFDDGAGWVSSVSRWSTKDWHSAHVATIGYADFAVTDRSGTHIFAAEKTGELVYLKPLPGDEYTSIQFGFADLAPRFFGGDWSVRFSPDGKSLIHAGHTWIGTGWLTLYNVDDVMRTKKNAQISRDDADETGTCSGCVKVKGGATSDGREWMRGEGRRTAIGAPLHLAAEIPYAPESISPSNDHVALQKDKWVGIFSVATRRRVVTFSPLPARPTSERRWIDWMAWSKDGTRVYVLAGSEFSIYDAKTGKRSNVSTFEAPYRTVREIAPDLVLLSDDEMGVDAPLWDTQANKVVRKTQWSHDSVLLPGGRVLVRERSHLGDVGPFRVEDVRTGKVLLAEPTANWACKKCGGFTLSPDESVVAVFDQGDGSLGLIRTKDVAQVKVYIYVVDKKETPFVLASNGDYGGPETLKHCAAKSGIAPVKKVDHLLKAFFSEP